MHNIINFLSSFFLLIPIYFSYHYKKNTELIVMTFILINSTLYCYTNNNTIRIIDMMSNIIFGIIFLYLYNDSLLYLLYCMLMMFYLSIRYFPCKY